MADPTQVSVVPLDLSGSWNRTLIKRRRVT